MLHKITKNVIGTPFLGLFLLAIVFYGCQDQEASDESLTPSEEPVKSVYAQLEESLMPFGQIALRYSQEPSFRSLVYEEIEKQFDGDYNVLLETVRDRRMEANRGGGQELSDALICFTQTYVLEEKLYPQIYIPFYESVRKRKEASRGSEETQPYILLYDGDEGREVWPGYTIDEAGELVEAGINIDETFAEEHEVWVISINERIEDGAVMDFVEVEETTEGARVMTPVTGIISRLDFNCRKESFPSGKHDIHIRRYTSWYAATDPGTSEVGVYNRLGSSDPTGDKIADIDIDNSDIKGDKWRVKNLSYNYTNGWNTDKGDYMVYVIFEKDEYPAEKRETPGIFLPGTSGSFDRLQIEYRSYDTSYIYDYISSGSSQSYYAENSCIRVYCSAP